MGLRKVCRFLRRFSKDSKSIVLREDIMCIFSPISVKTNSMEWAEIAQSVQRLATGWTVRGSNPGGGLDFQNLEPTQPPVQWLPGHSRR